MDRFARFFAFIVLVIAESGGSARAQFASGPSPDAASFAPFQRTGSSSSMRSADTMTCESPLSGQPSSSW